MGDAITSYKGFDKDLKCHGGFQYEVGKEYEQDSAKVCDHGFHACEMPLHVFNHFAPGAGSRYCVVEQSGEISRKQEEGDSKLASSKIKIGAEIGIPGLVKAQIEYVKERTKPSGKHHSTGSRSANSATGSGSANSATGDWSANSATGDWSANSATGYGSANSATGSRSANSATGDCSANSATGDWSANSATGSRSANSATGSGSANSATGSGSVNSATGDWSANSATGDWSANSATGYGSANVSTGNMCTNEGAGERNICVAWGKDSKCKGAIGCFLVLSEWGPWNGKVYPFLGAVMVEVDGKSILPDTWYTLKNGEIVACN